MKPYAFILLIFLLLPCALKAQDFSRHAESDQIYYVHTEDTTHTDDKEEYKYYIDLRRQPIAARAVWLGAIVPGLGQIYNGSYWKLAIV